MQKNRFLVLLGAAVVIVLIVSLIKNGIGGLGSGTQVAQVNSVGPVVPNTYYRFENNLNPTNGAGTYPIAGTTFASNCGAAGSCLAQTPDDSVGTFAASNFGNLSKFSAELAFKAGPNMQTTIFFDSRPSSVVAASLDWPGSGLSIPTVNFSVNGSTFSIPLSGIGLNDWSYFTDGNWHHMAFTYDGTTGKRAIWVDGMKMGEQTGTTGNIDLSSNNMYAGGLVDYRRLSGWLDEEAFYKNTLIPDLLIAQHARDVLVDHVAYNTTNTSVTSVPATPPSTAAVDPLDYVPNYATNIAGAPTLLTQIRSYPLPRFKPGNTLHENMNWFGIYAGGYKQANTTDGQAGVEYANIVDELSKNWNYGMMVNWDDGSTNNSFQTPLIALANQHPERKLHVGTARAQANYNYNVNGVHSILDSQNFAANHYIQNSSGQFLDSEGCGVSSTKTWRPVMAYISDYNQDGTEAAARFTTSLAGLTHPINLLAEDGEVLGNYVGCIDNDPVVVAEKNAYNTSHGTNYTTAEYAGLAIAANMHQSYFDIIKSSNPTLFGNTKFVQYGLDGGLQYRPRWKTARTVNDSLNGQYYATTMGIYQGSYGSHGPNGWNTSVSASLGLAYIENARINEIPLGDNLFSPFVAAGWMSGSTADPVADPTYPTDDMNPSEWLSMNNILSAWGAEFFYPGYYSEQGGYGAGLPLPSNPKTFAWQMVAPVYAQATTSRYESLLRNGAIVTGTSGNLPIDGSTNISATDGLRLASTDRQAPVVARVSGSRYLISTAWMRNHNMTLPANRKQKNVCASLGGNNICFETRIQGSTYIYDNSNSAAPIFYQLDGWHESTHPYYWTTDFNAEAENFDTGTAGIKTEGSGVASRNFTPGNYTSYIAPASGTSGYVFQRRNATTSGTSAPLYFWYNARSASGTSTGSVKIDSGTSSTIQATNSTYGWCNKNAAGQVISFPGVTENVDHTLNFTGTNANFYFDKFVITTDPALNLGTCAGGVSDTVAPSISITAPTASATYASSSPSVSLAGTSSDNTGVTSVTAVNAAAGAGAIIVSGTTSWSGTVSLVAGLNSIVVTAYDAAGNSSTDTLDITYTPADTIVPTVTVSTPVSTGGSYTATTSTLTTLAGSASDNVGVTTVTWTNSLGGSGTATGTNAWSVPSITLANGANIITVTVKDAANNTSTASITVNRDSQAPTVSMTAPINGAQINGTTPITLTANATDNFGIDHVDFYYNGTQFIGGATSVVNSNYSRSWTPSVSGSVTLTAKAYDTSGNPATSTSISVNISLSVPDVTAPTAQMVNPSAGATVSGTAVTLGAVASDNVGVSSVAFFLDGTAISGAVDTTGNNPNTNTTGLPGQLYEAVWNASSVSNGTHALTAKAYDAAGNMVTTSSVSVTVSNSVGQPDLIVTNLTWNPANPVSGDAVTFVATVKNQGTGATIAGKVTSVTFNVNGVYTSCGDGYTASIPAGGTITVTSGDTSALTQNWCNSGLPGGHQSPTWTATSGSKTILANVDDINRIAESNEGNNTLTKTLTIGSDSTAPMVTITAPTVETSYTSTSTTLTTLAGTTSDNVGVTTVTWNNSLGGSGTATGTTNWSVPSIALQTGTNVITVSAYDAAGNVSSDQVSVTYMPAATDTLDPSVNIISPANKADVSNVDPVSFVANVTDNVGVTSVKFYLNSTSSTPKCVLTAPTTAPKTYACSIMVPTTWLGYSTIVVEGQDAAGNINRKSIKVK